MARGDVLYKVVQKVGENAYKIELSKTCIHLPPLMLEILLLTLRQ